MEQKVKTDVAGLKKTAIFQSLQVDANGNYELNVNYQFTDLNDNVLKYDDPTKASGIIKITVPDPAKAVEELTEDEKAAQAAATSLLASLGPILKNLIPDSL